MPVDAVPRDRSNVIVVPDRLMAVYRPTVPEPPEVRLKVLPTSAATKGLMTLVAVVVVAPITISV
jgi:hypothetical protein